MRALGALMLAFGAAGSANAAVVNGSFEVGLLGWSLAPPSGAMAGVENASFGVTPTDASLQAFIETSDVDGAAAAAVEAFFGLPFDSIAELGNTPRGVAIGQAVNFSAGDVLSFDWNMLSLELTQDGIVSSFADFAVFVADKTVFPLHDVNQMDFVPSAAFLRGSPATETGYRSVSYTLGTDGPQLLGFGVFNTSDIAAQSALLIDNVRVTPAPISLPGAGGLMLGGLVLAGAAALSGRRAGRVRRRPT
jgi:hypothetical protein